MTVPAYTEVLDDCGAEGRAGRCDHCGVAGLDEAGLSLPIGEYGFCSVAHLVLWVRDRLMLGRVVMSPTIVFSSGCEAIYHERLRQINAEGYAPEDDVRRKCLGDLAIAAWCYLADHIDESGDVRARHVPPFEWPWVEDAWKPTPDDPVRQLVKAGALIAAEIDRLLALKARADKGIA